MNHTFSKVFVTLSLLVGSVTTTHAQIIDNPRMLSFENNTDLNSISTSKSKVSLSSKHYKNGNQALEWEYKAGATLSVKRNLMFEPKDKTGRDNYLSAFIVWLYNEKPQPGKQARFDFLKDGKPCTTFPVNLDFKGWRGIWVCYERDMQGTPAEGMNEIRISAPNEAGTLWIDHLITSVKVDPRQQTADMVVPFVNAKTTNHWLTILKNYSTKSDLPLTAVTEQDRRDIAQMEERFRSLVYTPSKLYPKQMEEMRTKFKKYRIKVSKGFVTGQGIWYTRQAEAYERMIPGWDKYYLDRTGFEMNNYFVLMEQIARAYNNSTEIADMEELKGMFMQMYDHITDQGVTWGSCWGNIHHYGYSMRSMYIAYFLMKDVLREAGKLGEAVKTMIWYSQLNELYAKPQGNGFDMDTFNTASTGCMATILLMDDSPEKVRYLRSCSRWLDYGCRPAPGLDDAFKSDGSAYHHCNLYPAYAVGGLNGATQMLYILSGTQFAVGKQAHETVKNALLAMRFYCNLTHFPLALSGRHPDGKGQLQPLHYAYMAMAGTPDGAMKTDMDMLAAYLRLVGTPKSTLEKKIHATLTALGVPAELAPQGNLSLPYGCTSVHRRGNWSAVVRGQSRYLWGAEHYVNENRYGRYLSYGTLQIMSAPSGTTVTPASSGWQEAGFDWNRIPGATSIHLPYDLLEAKIRNVDLSSGVEEMLITDEAFAGGLSQVGQNGNFGIKLHEHAKYNGSFRARKSYHFFNNVIVCLGSNITDTVTTYPTETTIFQLAATNEKQAGYWKNYTPAGNHTWIDANGTGYYSPNTLHYTGAVEQTSRSENYGKETKGLWATLYIDHGHAPKAGTYEYAVLPQTTQEAMNRFAAAPTYQVIRCDSTAHIVKSSATGTISYVLFETPKGILPGGPLLKADTACLAMIQTAGAKRLILTVAQPDLALYRGAADDIYKDGKLVERSIYSRKWRSNPSQDIPVRVTLAGKWHFTATDNIRLVSSDAKTTTIEFTCTEGKSYDLSLDKQP